jgi:hypothetical protein
MPAPSEINANFNQYIDTHTQRLTVLKTVLETALPIVSDIHLCNEELVRANRPDLIMIGRAEMMHVSSPEDILKICNNFTPKFYFDIGYEIRPTEGKHFEETIPISINESQLKSLTKEGVSFDDFLLTEDGWSNNHADKPAFLRMLVLFTEFTVPFVLAMSATDEHGKRKDEIWLAPELFIAYQLMSQLVDTKDKYVLKDDGKIDDWYLCR